MTYSMTSAARGVIAIQVVYVTSAARSVIARHVTPVARSVIARHVTPVARRVIAIHVTPVPRSVIARHVTPVARRVGHHYNMLYIAYLLATITFINKIKPNLCQPWKVSYIAYI